MKLILYRVYQSTIMWPLMLIATILTAIITIIFCSLGAGRTMGYYPEAIWGKIMCWLTLVKVSVKGRENIDPGTSYVFVCNHQSAYDIFSVYGWLGHNFRWLMKAPLRKIPLVGYACVKARMVFVDNSSPSAVRRTMADAERILSDGMSIVVFPEGARTPDGRMHRFKRGAYQLAMEFNLPVVPITIDGAYSVMTRRQKLPHWGHIHLTIHRPIHAPAGGHELQALMDESYAVIASSLEN